MNERAPVHQYGINMGFIYVSPAVKERENHQTAAEQKPESLCFLFYFHWRMKERKKEKTKKKYQIYKKYE